MPTNLARMYINTCECERSKRRSIYLFSKTAIRTNASLDRGFRVGEYSGCSALVISLRILSEID